MNLYVESPNTVHVDRQVWMSQSMVNIVRTDHVLLFNHLNIKTAHGYKSRYDWYTPHTVTPWDSIKIKILKEFSLKS